ncbi:MAG: thioredoxin-dependent thiol peroxidase [candidate division Zixibacteria bacterium]|nr:thioredoxin-dependent thiol peroxidase [candidate division Zixibacteria bacterium]
MLEVGDKVPAFTLEQTDGARVRSADWKDQTVVLYFYPKDDTPGCTRQACSLRDGYAKLKHSGVAVYGISPDTVASHQKFTEKFSLPFPLLADPDHAVAEKFGVWVEKNMYGKKSMGIARTTFIIRGCKIVDIIKKVDTENHAQQVLEHLPGK